MSAGLEVLIVMLIFLGLLAAGMAIPFAIGVPAIVYLLLHGGVPALRGIGLMSWGSMIGSGREMLRTDWYITAVPGCAILLTVLALNLIGEGLNDALNPKLRDR